MTALRIYENDETDFMVTVPTIWGPKQTQTATQTQT